MKDLTKGNETGTIVAFALPMLIGNVFQQFYGMVDSIIVGKFVGTQALAAVGTSFPVIFLMISLIMGLTMGTTVLVAQYFGAKDGPRVRAAVDTGYITLFWAGLAMSVVGVVSTEGILTLLKVPADVFRPAAFPVVRSYLDQLVRGNGLPAARTREIAAAIDAAEQATGSARAERLNQLATALDRDAAGASDAERVRAMAAAVRELANASR